MCLRILITNHGLEEYCGTELYVRDVALELRRQGHIPAVYTHWMGKVSDELSAAGIPVTNSLRQFHFEPDIIHGHHQIETLSAITRFPDTPALFICHNHSSWVEIPPLHSHILRYYGVSEVCIKKLRDSGVSDEKIGRLYNFVDLQRFEPRPPLPAKARRALVFSNYATTDTYLPVITEACRQAGLELDVVGRGVGNQIAQPEEILAQYDIVFAKAKAAMESMAVGNAVVLCDFGGLGPMVTAENFDELRPMNFGFQALTEPHTTENVLRQIERYDACDARSVRDKLRSCAGLDHAVTELIGTYQQVVDEYRAQRPIRGGLRDIRCIATIARYLPAYKAMDLWKSLSPQQQLAVSNSRGLNAIRRGIRCICCGREK